MSEKMIKRTDEIIAELVREKVEFQKAYNYYHGERDEEQFKYLEENFGIGSPTSVKMTPMVKKHEGREPQRRSGRPQRWRRSGSCGWGWWYCGRSDG